MLLPPGRKIKQDCRVNELPRREAPHSAATLHCVKKHTKTLGHAIENPFPVVMT
jgi:hypothetical protein